MFGFDIDPSHLKRVLYKNKVNSKKLYCIQLNISPIACWYLLLLDLLYYTPYMLSNIAKILDSCLLLPQDINIFYKICK